MNLRAEGHQKVPGGLAPLRPLVQQEPERYFCCRHCGYPNVDQYMVQNDVWDAVGPGPDWPGVLHLACLEKRLRRHLAAEDFTHAPINGWVAHIRDPHETRQTATARLGKSAWSGSGAGVGLLLYLTAHYTSQELLDHIKKDLPIPGRGISASQMERSLSAEPPSS